MDIAYFRRPLKDFSDKIGNCVFFEDEKRAPKFAIDSLEFVAISRIINELKAISNDTGLVFDVKDVIEKTLNEARKIKKFTYAKFRKILFLDEKITFKSLRYIKNNPENSEFINLGGFVELSKIIGDNFTRDEFNKIALYATLSKDTNLLRQKLREIGLDKFDDETLNSILNLKYAHFINLSFKALQKILPYMKDGFRYDEACIQAGLSIKSNLNKSDFLPPFIDTPYSDQLTNPVVSRAVREYRKVVNSIVKKHGKFHKIHIELAREIGKTFEERKKIETEQANNHKLNNEAMIFCQEIGLNPYSNQNILKIKLWREQQEICMYSGKKISINDILSNLVEIDHILPYSRSFDDSMSNKVLVFAKFNQEKKNQTPYEAFSDKDFWNDIVLRAKSLNNSSKFKKLTTANFVNKKDGSDFIQRNLNDTRYISRLVVNYTRDYLNFLDFDDGKKEHLLCVNGSLTSMLRHYWGFGDKDRNGHIHHFVDAAILSACSPSVIKAFSDFKKTEEINNAKYYADKISGLRIKSKFDPFINFRSIVLDAAKNIFVSKPPRKKVTGALHQETIISKDDILKEQKYGSELGLNRALNLGKIRQINYGYVDNAEMPRVDIFADRKNGKFYGVPIYTMDFALGILPNKACVKGKDNQGNIKDWLEMDENYEFKFSLFKDDLIRIQKSGMSEAVVCYYNSFNVSSCSISVEKHNADAKDLSDNEKLLYPSSKNKRKKDDLDDASPATYEAIQPSLGIQSLLKFEKLIVSPLGEISEFKFEPRADVRLKTSKKTNNV